MAAVARLFRESFRATYPSFPELHTPEEDLAFFENVVFQRASIHLAEESGSRRLLGFIAFRPEFIDHLYVAPEAQGKGIGSRLLEIALANASRVQLWTFQENARARAFYRKHGFVEIRATEGAENEEKRPDVLMEWADEA